jgi:hypothetical protein
MTGLLPVAPATFLHVVGLIEMVGGLMILTRWVRLGAYLAAAWLSAIALNLILAGRFDIAVRDLVMAVGAWTLAQLAAVRRTQTTDSAMPSREALHATA